MAKKNRGVAKALSRIYNKARKTEQPLVEADKSLVQLYGPKMEKMNAEDRKQFVIDKMKAGRTALKRRLVKITIDGELVNVPVARITGDDDVTHIYLLRTDENGKPVKGLDGKPIHERELTEGEYVELDPPTFWANNRKNSETDLLDSMLEDAFDL